MADSGSNGNGIVRWQVWASIAAVATVLMTSLFNLWFTANTAATTGVELKDRVVKLEAQISADRIDISSLKNRNTEIETQFRASDQVRNLMHASDMRVLALLWHKSYKEDYPIQNAYYPTIARDPQNDK